MLANGLNIGLRTMLGIERQVISSCHSITLGFDVAPVGRAAFDFPALTYWPKRASSRMAYMTIFPIGGAMRVNLMVYRDMTDPWLPAFRKAPEAAMLALMPRLKRMMGDFKVSSQIKIRPADLCTTSGYLQPGIVLAGDAFSTSCPAAGTGTTKVFTDVGRLCNVYIPQWLTTDGMDARKIAQFYDDPEKQSPARRGAWKRPTTCVRCRSTTDCHGAPSAGPVSWQGWRKVPCARSARGFRRDRRNAVKVPSGQPRHGRLA